MKWSNTFNTIIISQRNNLSSFAQKHKKSYLKNCLTLIGLVFICQFGLAQSYNMDGTAITDCGGFFYDSGGSTGNYSASENLTTTICSDMTSGTHVQLIFSAVEIDAGDLICFFDGPDATAPFLSCNDDFDVGSPFIIQATAANTSGCLTITFNSDGGGESAGWQADMNCIPACQTILADLVNSDPIVSPPDTGYIDICQGERVFFNGEGVYPQNGIVYTHSDLTSTFEWDFGDGAIGLGPDVSHTYSEAGGYIVQLTITDQFGCTNTNFITQRVRVSTNPSFATLADIPNVLCAGDTVNLNAVVNNADSAFVVGVTPNEGSFPTAGVRSDSLALPDGTGVAYETSIGFSNFTPGQVLSNVNDLISICVVMEHSWMRDLEISIECPDGSEIVLHDHPGNFGGEVFLGEPFEADEGVPEPIPGVGYEYCWTPDATNGTWIEFANNTFGATGGGTLPEGNYNSADPMTNLLGCPLNGEWTIHVEDLWGIDNGFIFEWSIEFDPSLYPDIETFQPEIISYNWLSNPSIFYQTDDSISAAPQNAGTASYTFQVNDDYGCTYDTSVQITILPPTDPACFSCPAPELTLQDTSICDGELLQIDAESTSSLSNQEVTFESFPTYMFGNANHPPNNPYSATLEISSMTPSTINNAQAQICGVCLDLETDFDADIQIYLRSPSGQLLELSTNNGGAGDNYTGTCFRPSAGTSIIGSPAPFTGDFSPEGDWSDLNGSTINGIWELLVSDGFGINDMGILNSWSLCFNLENEVNYQWSPIAGLSCYDCPNPMANPTSTSTFEVEISDSYGCNYSDEMTVNVVANIAAPANVVCDTSFGGNINFVWDAVPGFTGYLVNVNGTGWVPANGGTEHLASGFSNGDDVNIEVQVDVNAVNCNVGIASNTCNYFVCEIFLELPPNGISAPSCFNTEDGTVIVNAMGNGTGPFTYQLDENPPENDGIFSLGSGDHFIILQDVDGCADTLNFVVPTTDSIMVSYSIDSAKCNGEATGEVTATATGGSGNFTYAWSTTPLLTFDQTLSDVAAGDYTLTVTDNAGGCEVIETITIEEPELLELTIDPTDVSCFNGNDGIATAMPTGGVGDYEFLWNDGQTTATASSLVAGTYTVIITDANDCEATLTQVINQPEGMELMLSTSSDVSCFGGNDGTIDLEVTGGMMPYDYLWDDNMTDEDRSSLEAATYCVTITDNNNCTRDTCFTINQPTEILLTIASTPTTCVGNNMDGTATILAQGGTGMNYQFLWSDDNNQTNSTATGLVPGNYCVTVTDGNMCTVVECVDVESPAIIVVDSIVATDVLCFGENSGITEVFASGGNGSFSYLWSDPLAQFSNPANSLLEGTYTVTITDAAFCTATATVVVNEPTLLTTTAVPTEVNCFEGNDGTILANPNGGVSPYTYSWSSTPGQSNQEATTLVTGTYTVTVTDFNGCTVTESAFIDQPPTAVSAVIDQTFIGCFEANNSQAEVTASGGTGTNYQYEWSDSPASTTATVMNLAAQNYSVTVTDENNCETVENIAITELDDIIVNIIQIEPSCFGNEDGQLGINIVAGGVGAGDIDNYSYNWSNGINNELNADITSGEYLVTITDAQNCSSVTTVNLDQPIEITATAQIDDALCFGSDDGQIQVNVSSDFPIIDYQWDNNADNQNTQTATDLAFGTYLVTVTDDTNCTMVTSFFVGQPDPLEVSFATEDNPCFGDELGSINADVTGGTPNYSYAWSVADTIGVFSSSDQNISQLETNMYRLQVTDDNGCIETQEVAVGSPPELWVTVEADSVTCFGDRDGSLFVQGQGGAPSYMYSLDGGDFTNSSTFLGLEVDNYNIEVLDRNGCKTSVSTNVGGPEEIIVDLGPNITIDLGQFANLEANVTPPNNYFYTWSPDDSLTCNTCPSTTVLDITYQTTFEVVVENEFGCIGKDLINVYVNKNRKVFVPTAFSPNGAEVNSRLRTHGREGTMVTSFQVYSRWGELVYENKEPYPINADDVGWDGTFKGKEMNPAVFVWQLEVEYIDGVKELHKGHTTLLR